MTHSGFAPSDGSTHTARQSNHKEPARAVEKSIDHRTDRKDGHSSCCIAAGVLDVFSSNKHQRWPTVGLFEKGSMGDDSVGGQMAP